MNYIFIINLFIQTLFIGKILCVYHHSGTIELTRKTVSALVEMTFQWRQQIINKVISEENKISDGIQNDSGKKCIQIRQSEWLFL